jgi:hypothetical protein
MRRGPGGADVAPRPADENPYVHAPPGGAGQQTGEVVVGSEIESARYRSAGVLPRVGGL